MKMNFFKTTFLSLLLVFSISAFVLPQFSYAQDSDGNKKINVSEKINNPLGGKYDTLNDFLKGLLEGIIKILIPFVALAIIYAGFLFVSARGNEEQLRTAKNALLYGVIGAGLIFGAWALAQLISDTVLKL